MVEGIHLLCFPFQTHDPLDLCAQWDVGLLWDNLLVHYGDGICQGTF